MGIVRFDRDRDRLQRLAEKSYSEGKYVSALRFTYAAIQEGGEDINAYLRMSDIYENLGLQTYAIKWLYKCLEICEEEDLPDVYEGLAVNYLNMGNEGASAYYYNRLIGVDDTLTAENKMEIAQAFARDKKESLRFVWPPRLADFSAEMAEGARALKAGNCRSAIAAYSKVEKGNKDYVEARRMQAVAELLEGNHLGAEKLCDEILETAPDDIQTLSTLAAIYLEQGRTAESRALAARLVKMPTDSTEELYKIATVCCENAMHAEAYALFLRLEERMPYDGRMLYFKAISAAKSGHLDVAERTLDKFCALYPDAAVGKYYLREVRKTLAGGEDTTSDFTYFYAVPKAAKDLICHTLISLGKMPSAQAAVFAHADDFIEDLLWCFDEMDGMDQDLQYVALMVAEHVRADGFVRDMLLDFEVSDVLKVETLRALYERNEADTFGVVLCNIYRSLPLRRIAIGRKKRKKFIGGYARVASKFAIISPSYGGRLKRAAEKLYRAIESMDATELFEREDDIACAIYLTSGLKELGNDVAQIAEAFDANPTRVKLLLMHVEN